MLLPALASADSLQIHLASEHQTDNPVVEKNYGIGYFARDSQGHWSVTVLRNSYGDPAAFGCRTYGHRIAAGACIVTGYENDTEAGEIGAAPVITMRVLDTRVSPRINLIPGPDGIVASVGIDIRYE